MATKYIKFKLNDLLTHSFIKSHNEKLTERIDDEGYYIGYAKMNNYYYFNKYLRKDNDEKQYVMYVPKSYATLELYKSENTNNDNIVMESIYNLIIASLTPEQIKELKHKL